MTETRKIAEAYIAAWNETDAARRGKLLDAVLTPDISYRDPLMRGDGEGGPQPTPLTAG
jgi:hypothetical protein